MPSIAVKDAATGSAKLVKARLRTDGTSPDVSGEYAPYHHINGISDGDYETVAAASTDQVLGAAGAAGDYLHHLIIVPAAVGAGTVSIKDGSGSSINVFVAGTLADLRTFTVHLFMTSSAGAWSVTTGNNVSVIAVGNFT